ncbi:NAD(P)-dependent oxidoreductase [Streptomyces europaeiscabiei]|uniref:NAD(P)-dependent oxidoreductase n=1 Tax=Streptomyces europaeiscabiei TaxID=146819 RepID=UPI000765F467|nr:NAD(P)-binding domain-containing protein [Streptomyces europaeiscabiei]MDX2761473.1 NAD(P)-binding domain-containing protein [Streptomyces europaeiscabiei]MDX3666434.1 NAD(P)-binding domain-containing protein [Streptomyces europaeiscabiei]MDX3711584.1 NAD(P)-binding domain-containing protein [Streptomyces europaeiscabiei]MDX3838110.1 NAD(P)-binding domain-containing protein [Streptomyces europaeiscabiei]MDX3840708.1 NAD(P)-binding domain-containing protein [Streptomyces europaeiscabiei]
MPAHTEQPTTGTGATTPTPTVTVLGLGPMGRALAGAFLDAGLRTTVWNRTPGRDGELAARGAARAGSAEEAVAASALTVVCVVNYDASDTILRSPAVTEALKGRTVVNLTADTPDRARSTAGWAAEHGVDYLDGAIMTPTPTIGTPDGVFLYSGPEDLYRAHRPVLDALSGTHTHLGEDIGRAATYDIALLDLFWTAIAGYTHALALARAEGVGARELTPFAQGIAAILPPLFEAGAEEVDSGRHSGEGNPLTSAVSTMAHIIQVSESHGIDAGVMRSAEGFARRAIAQGHGTDGFTRLTDVLANH